MGPQMSQVVAKQRILPKGWENTWTNLGITDVKFRPIELGRRKVNPMVAELSTLPTWVPNWCHHSPWDPAPLLDWSVNHPRYWAGGTMSSTYQPNVTSPAELNLTGIHFDTIETLAEPWHPTTQVPPVSRREFPVLQAWEHHAMSPVQNCPYKSTHGRKTATWRTHIADYAGNGAVPASDWRLLECWYDRIGWAKTLPDLDALAGKSIMRTVHMQGDVRSMDDAMLSHWLDLDEVDEDLSLSMRGITSVTKIYGTYVKRIHRVCAQRALFVTFVLRQHAADGVYEFVGELYLYGIMAGEAWSMGLPNQQVTII
ncbi:hypothetical protein FB567DRAFT_525287 [Paraphoma chrysanthemicola]|uniref:Uncharacterized protein n=1 Tax=Paraphoma chrysanthemicola TaxID=798071 RepID=A0A8K0VZJ4_9PLEO|nr:hypothetical protein FB567DRAFT_525287 [Paraphoma chrysanthemicola]